MLFALGYIAGVVTCTFIFAVIAATGADRKVDQAELGVKRALRGAIERIPENLPVGRTLREISGAGFVEIPPDDDELARQEIIERNRAEGRDTPISELQA